MPRSGRSTPKRKVPERSDPPETGVITVKVSLAACHDCDETIGPTLAEDVGRVLMDNHDDHDTETVDTWYESKIIDEEQFFRSEARTLRKTNNE